MTTTDRPTTTSDYPLMTSAEVADMLGVGERFIRRLTSERRLPFIKIGAKVRFAREDVEGYVLASRREAGVPVAPDPLAEHSATTHESQQRLAHERSEQSA